MQRVAVEDMAAAVDTQVAEAAGMVVAVVVDITRPTRKLIVTGGEANWLRRFSLGKAGVVAPVRVPI